jgi:hypothetical protein
VGWQPSRFLADHAEAERAFALAEQLGSVNAAANELGTTWPSLRKAFTRHGLGMRARNPRPSASGRSRSPASAAGGRPPRPWTRCLWRSTLAPSRPENARRASCMSGSAATRSTPSWAQPAGRAEQREPRSPAHHSGLGDHPPGRPQRPAGRPTRQLAQPPLRRPPRWGRPHPPTSGAGGDCRCPLIPPAATSRTASGGVRLFAGHSGRVGGGLRLAGGRQGGHRPPIGLAIGPGSGLLSQLGPGHAPETSHARLRGHGPLRWDLGCSSARLVRFRPSRDGALVRMHG